MAFCGHGSPGAVQIMTGRVHTRQAPDAYFIVITMARSWSGLVIHVISIYWFTWRAAEPYHTLENQPVAWRSVPDMDVDRRTVTCGLCSWLFVAWLCRREMFISLLTQSLQQPHGIECIYSFCECSLLDLHQSWPYTMTMWTSIFISIPVRHFSCL
jgi:hypothetical protein